VSFNGEPMKPVTEQINPNTKEIDRLSSLEIVKLINEEDRAVAEAVSHVLEDVARAVNLTVKRLDAGGRLIYIGTGTSGRLGVLDASECPPTFGVSPELVRGVIAGGLDALHRSIEAAEDDPAQAARDLDALDLSPLDAVVGISASGNTPYTVGAIEHAKNGGAVTIAITCNPESEMAALAEVSIAPVVGPEAIAGSSRMKAGTAQKMVLNMLSTAAMIRMGLVYSNLMSNLKATNDKLRRRAVDILSEEAGITVEQAQYAFKAAGEDLRLALLIFRSELSLEEAEQLLASHNGSVRRALDSLS
jgi:N-acetylmuramic acid 6-phosphate etherase